MPECIDAILRHHLNLKRNHTKMKFNCLFINKRTNAKISKDFTVKEIDTYLGEYIKELHLTRLNGKNS